MKRQTRAEKAARLQAAARALPRNALHRFGLEAILDEDRIHRFDLPHNGQQSGPRCQTPYHLVHFPGGGKAHYRQVRHDCKEFDCPTCCSTPKPSKPDEYDIRGWEQREALAIDQRIQHARTNRSLADFPVHRFSACKRRSRRAGLHPFVYHVIVSPPQGWMRARLGTKSAWRQAWAMLIRICKSRGIMGGVAVFHPSRIPSRWNDRTCGTSGPHWHVLGFTLWGDAWDGQVCGILYGGGRIDTKPALKARLIQLGMAKRDTAGVVGDGWIVKVKPKRKSVYATAAYILSHAGRPMVQDGPPEAAYPASPRSMSGEKRQGTGTVERELVPYGTVPHWFGTCSYNQLKVPESPESDIPCPVCKVGVPFDLWFVMSWVGQDKPPDDLHGETDADAWDIPSLGAGLPPWMARERDARDALLREVMQR